jgi:hypothetical protein
MEKGSPIIGCNTIKNLVFYHQFTNSLDAFRLRAVVAVLNPYLYNTVPLHCSALTDPTWS